MTDQCTTCRADAKDRAVADQAQKDRKRVAKFLMRLSDEVRRRANVNLQSGLAVGAYADSRETLLLIDAASAVKCGGHASTLTLADCGEEPSK